MIQEREHRSDPSVMTGPKNVWLAVVLAGLLGPFGLAYATVRGAIIMLVVAIGLAMFTFGLGFFFVWPFCAVWAWRAAIAHNKEALHESKHRHIESVGPFAKNG